MSSLALISGWCYIYTSYYNSDIEGLEYWPSNNKFKVLTSRIMKIMIGADNH